MNQENFISSKSAKYIPYVILIFFALYLIQSFKLPKSASPFDTNKFGALPVLQGGRIKPLDTVARTSLLMLSGKQTTKDLEGKKIPAISWLMEVLFSKGKADTMKVFEIDDPDVLGLIGIQQKDERLFAYESLEKHLEEIDTQYSLAARRPDDNRTRFQNAIINLRDKIFLYEKLRASLAFSDGPSQKNALEAFDKAVTEAKKSSSGGQALSSEYSNILNENLYRYQQMEQMTEFLPIPSGTEVSDNNNEWISTSRALLKRLDTQSLLPGLVAYANLADLFNQNNSEEFNSTLEKFFNEIKKSRPSSISQAESELIFNNFEPFYKSILVYVCVFLLAFIYLLTGKEGFNKSAFLLLILAFSVHTLGLAARIILQGRPPVTNLYSSAVFVGWGSVFLGMVLEKIFKNSIGSIVSAIVGFTTLIIAHHLSLQGDTMEMMRAVLDSNFWLATHVITVTIGYSSTLLSGLLAIIYLIRRAFDRKFDLQTAQVLGRMTYAVVCFSLIFSFIGTVLGGIWADQSWGRFWGWDPKENGALLVVIWNTMLLHTRFYLKQETIMMLTVFGNVITALSWFGVNMLGVGLHSYGFMDKALYWLVIFIISQLLIMSLRFFPVRFKELQT